MYRKIRFSLVLALGLIIAISNASLVSAHTTSQEGILKADHYVYGGWYIGSESIGWSIDEDYHNGSTTLYYKWKSGDPYLTTVRKGWYQTAAAKWASCGTVAYSTSLAKGTFGTFTASTSEMGTIAKFYDFTANSSGHLTAWKIDMNWKISSSYTDEKWATFLAHEMGHAYGLNDLYSMTSPNNKSKLMYGFYDGTATGPTTTDLNGFSVITGVHSYHLFNNSGVCTICGGMEEE